MEESTEKTEKTKKTTKHVITGSLYCKPEKRRQSLLGRTSGRYCPKCGFKIRGTNHEEGAHHNSGGSGKMKMSRVKKF